MYQNSLVWICVSKLLMQFMQYSDGCINLACQRRMWISHFVQSKRIEMYQQEFPSIDCSILEFFCVSLYASYFPELH